jgi:RNA polymerase sigma-70 factor (ECF subfamily)
MAQPDAARDRADRDAEQWGAWMAAAQDGDRVAYNRLLRAILPYIRAMASRAFRERADAEDVAQDILIALHEVRASYDPSRPFKPWLAGIARHRIIDRLRQRGRTAARETALAAEHETFASVASNQDGMTIDSHALHQAITQLPEGQRVAIEELKLREGSLQSVSTRTGLSVGALKVATHRGIGRLRALLTKGDPP